MDWHFFHSVAASFLALFGFFLDLQSLLSGIRTFGNRSGPKGIMGWPILLYVAAAFTADESLAFRYWAIGCGIVFHLISTVGIRLVGRLIAGRKDGS